MIKQSFIVNIESDVGVTSDRVKILLLRAVLEDLGFTIEKIAVNELPSFIDTFANTWITEHRKRLGMED